MINTIYDYILDTKYSSTEEGIKLRNKIIDDFKDKRIALRPISQLYWHIEDIELLRNSNENILKEKDISSLLLHCISLLLNCIPERKGDVSDGYHTFVELYDYRRAYNAMLVNEYAKQGLYNVHKSWKHNDGQECFGGGWFVVQMELPTGQVSNHYEAKYWNEFQCEEREVSDAWDGHTPQQALERMIKFLNS